MRRLSSLPLIIVLAGIIFIIGTGIVVASIFIGGGGASNEEVNLQKGLVGHWKMDGNAKDSTPYGNNGTLAGNAAVTANDRKGQVNKALSLDGTGDYVNAGNNSSINITGNLTLGLWVNFNSLTNYQEFVGKFGGTDGADTAYEFRKTSAAAGNNLQFCHGNGTSEPCATVSTGALSSTGTWYHVVVTRSGTTISFYINGALDSSPTLAGTVPGTTGNAWLGERNDGNYPLDGKLDDIRIYNRALSAAEITALYQEYDPGIQVSDLQKGLVGQWKLDGNAKDSTPYGNNGTLTGTTQTTDRKGTANKAYSFNGTSDYVEVADNNSFEFGTGDFTISLWAKFNVLPADTVHDPMISRYVDDSNNNWFFSIYNNGGSYMPHFYGFKGGVNFNNSITLPSLTASTWRHFVVTRTSSTIALYADAVSYSVNGTANSNDLTYSSSLFMGRMNTQYSNVVLDEVRVYNRALSATEITALYQSYDPGIVVSDLQKGLVGQWKMDGNAKDSTPYGNNGTLTGTTQTTDRKGAANKAYSFNGTSNYVDAGKGSSLDNSGALTIEAWIKPNAVAGSYIVGNYSSGATHSQYTMGITSGYLRFLSEKPVGEGGGFLSVLGTTRQINTGQWYHVAVTRASADGTVTLYVDGIADGTTGTSAANKIANFADVGNAAIGRTGNLDATYFNGSIDDVRVYNRALSATEITALYESY